MFIREIQIKNFRSIRNLNLNASHFNVIVGLNDVGKSNILRALNLFFNGETDNGCPYDFDIDFAYHFPANSKKAKETSISITFDLPESYLTPDRDFSAVIWKKSWRKNGEQSPTICDDHSRPLPPLSRIPFALKSIRYRYVPAVKSKEFYKTLLVDLYHTLSKSLRVPLRESTEEFSNSIKNNTEKLTENLWDALSLRSVLTVPNNLDSFFKSLTFDTKNDADPFSVTLDARGDGVQAEHIPQILKFMANEDQNSRTKGSPRIYTIWGYEEPENGLEISRAFKLAEQFVSVSPDIQIFITTHSPAFYLKAKEHEKNVTGSSTITYVKKESTGESKIISNPDTSFLNEEIGLMPIIAPYIEASINELNAYKRLAKNFLTDIPTIAVEGITDERYLRKSIELYSPTLWTLMQSSKLRILSNQESGGTNQIIEWGKAWCHAGFQNKILFLLDADPAGDNARKSLQNDSKVHEKCSQHKMKILQLQKPPFACTLAQKHIIVPITVEHLVSNSIWNIAKSSNWLVKRDDSSIRKMLIQVLPENITLADYLNELVQSLGDDSNCFQYMVREQSKNCFCDTALASATTSNDILKLFQPIVQDIEKFFS